LSDRLTLTKGKDEIAEMAKTFNSMLDQLETTFELQRNFIGNASHELNTPLTAIMGEAEVILQSPRTTDEYVQSLKVILYEARKLDDVTSSLLKLSSISYEAKKQKIELLHLDELLMEVKISFDTRMPSNKVKVLIQNNDSRPNAFSLVGSSIWLELAITNVVQNSIKYSDNKEVLVTLSSDPAHALIEISDQGIGIPDDELRYVFEPFFRARNTAPYKGYGIGLPLAARIVKLHAGELNIYSKPNVGTKVTLTFPIQPASTSNET
jgi:signal transduction histidine kinase